jgi:hypothetical protein
MSRNISRRLQIRNQRSTEPDLFSWRPAVVQPATRAARKLAARYGLSLAHASTIAKLAGLGIDGEAR